MCKILSHLFKGRLVYLGHYTVTRSLIFHASFLFTFPTSDINYAKQTPPELSLDTRQRTHFSKIHKETLSFERAAQIYGKFSFSVLSAPNVNNSRGPSKGKVCLYIGKAGRGFSADNFSYLSFLHGAFPENLSLNLWWADGETVIY